MIENRTSFMKWVRIQFYTHTIPTTAPVLKPLHFPGHAHLEYNVVDCKANNIDDFRILGIGLQLAYDGNS